MQESPAARAPRIVSALLGVAIIKKSQAVQKRTAWRQSIT